MKTVASAGKIIAMVFWESHGTQIIWKTTGPSPDSIKLRYWTNRRKLFRLNVHIWLKRKCSFTTTMYLAHTSIVVAAKLHDLCFKVLPHALYSLDLAPNDHFLFSNLQKWLSGQRFTSNDEVKSETTSYFAELDKAYYAECIK